MGHCDVWGEIFRERGYFLLAWQPVQPQATA